MRRLAGTKIASAVFGLVVAGAGVAVANWAVSLNSGMTGEGQSATIQNLTISAVASPSATNLLYPGGTGDVVVNIHNPNGYNVKITAVTLPTNTTYAAGYSNSALSTPMSGCDATSSLVAWRFADSASHTLTSALVVPASGDLAVTFDNDAVMGSGSPTECASTYFSMPAFTAITAASDTATATTSPVHSGWTS